MIGFFSQLRVGTRLTLGNFVTSKNYGHISQYFPTYLPGESVVTHEANCEFYIPLLGTDTSIDISYNNRSVKVSMDSDFGNIKILEIYQAKKSFPASVDKIGGNSKVLNLRQIHDKVKVSPGYAWCYAVIVDCCASYIPKQGDSSDYLVIYKLTDKSIFPEIISLNVFHKNPKEIPKVENFGDIIKLNDVQFKEHQGKLSAVITSNTKTMSFYIFSHTGDCYSPYASYKSQFHSNSEHALKLEKLSDWVRTTFPYEVPNFMKSSKRLTNINFSDETDVITKIIAIYPLGIHENDPSIVICNDTNEIAQLVIPNERKRLLKFIKPGDVVRIRGVCYEEKVLYLKHYSEILKIPTEFKCLEIPGPSDFDEIIKFMNFYSPIPTCKIVSSITSEFSALPIIEFDKIMNIEDNKHIKIEGFIVKAVVRNREIIISIWDGIKEDNVIKVYVAEGKVKDFINGKSWDYIQKAVIGYNLKFQGIVRMDHDALWLVDTSLI
ncbi:hypothetical protein SteCoe_22958 [Stentor coeruleus]|uniref:Telomeric single stranded DNA binding POT1/Cdc13 domain-containing protein n=1 Tax=Stentor coeruleus TaxID=5963 RepID=A0A1R2BL22_9CILI|nr:hypothetical protein SteCoe_22958 [Stentor coeruleus]